jgi:hypothetical protein
MRWELIVEVSSDHLQEALSRWLIEQGFDVPDWDRFEWVPVYDPASPRDLLAASVSARWGQDSDGGGSHTSDDDTDDIPDLTATTPSR